MIKKIGYVVFAVFFAIFRIAPLQLKKVFYVATHDDSEEGNIGIVAAALREKRPDMRHVFLTKKDNIRHPFSFFVVKAYHMATAGTIFLDNEFMPMAYLPVSNRANVVQLWHGTGTIKKFGLDAERGEVARLALKANRHITHLIVNSELTKKQYASAFGISPERIFMLGLPRTDLILDTARMEKKRNHFLEQYPELKGKRCILYAPTFRDDETMEPKLHLDLEHLCGSLGENEVLLLRLHPHVSGFFGNDEKPDLYGGKVWNMSNYPWVTTLLSAADSLITDYSSIIFEYCLLERPMIFYAYDIDRFRTEGRGFYEDYETYVPGPVVRTQAELEAVLTRGDFDEDIVRNFVDRTFLYRDKNAVARLFELIF